MIRHLPAHLFFYVLFSITLVQAREQVAPNPEHIIEKELLLNELIANLYLLQLDAKNQIAREAIDELSIQLDEAFKKITNESSNPLTQQLLSSSKDQWHRINQDIPVLLNHKDRINTTNAVATTHKSLILDRQLLTLRKALWKEQPQVNEPLRFMTQALLMQKLTREYLSLSAASQTMTSHIKQEQLQAMTREFNDSLKAIKKELINHRHAEASIKKASMAWHFIADSIDSFPEQPVPTTIVIYSNRIIRQLSSLHHMF